jgi:flagellar biosynthesis protein FlhB
MGATSIDLSAGVIILFITCLLVGMYYIIKEEYGMAFKALIKGLWYNKKKRLLSRLFAILLIAYCSPMIILYFIVKLVKLIFNILLKKLKRR